MTAHDEAVKQLAAALTGFFRHRSRHIVLTAARWQPLEDFPNCVETFDIAIVPAGSGMATEGKVSVPPQQTPTTLIDVVTRDTDYENEFYDKPELLLHSSAYEYCLYDPTREVLRPSLQAYRKGDDGWKTPKTCSRGLFFSTLGFRLDVREGLPVVTPCGSVWAEEEMFGLRLRIESLSSGEQRAEEVAGLDRRVRDLEQRLAASRPERDDE